MAGRLWRVLRLPPSEQLGLARLAAVRAAIEPALRTMPLPRLARMLGLRMGSSADQPAPPLQSDALSNAELRAVRAADVLTAHAGGEKRCLRHALLAGHALRKHGPVLRLGAARRAGETVAHAWIEVLGGRIDVDDATEYLPLRAARTDPDRMLYEAVRDGRTDELLASLGDDGPADLVAYLKKHRDRSVKLALAIGAEAARAVKALSRAGVQVVAEGDVVRVGDRENAIAVLQKEGFTRAGDALVRSERDLVLQIRGVDEPLPKQAAESLGLYEPTPPSVVEAMLDLAEVGPDDVVVDLGSGDGRVLEAAEKRGARAIGYETDPVLADSARARGLSVHTVDAAGADLSAATVVTLYVTLEAGLRMQPQLKRFVARGGRVVAHHFDLGLWPCTKEIVVDTGSARRHVRLWTTT